ncbi:hypothetical protein ACWDBD_17475 [Streptomyces sp. NPDC001118]
MALTLTQVAVGSTASAIVTLPPGGTVTLVASAPTTVGTSSAVTSSTGFTLPANVPVPLTLMDELAQSALTLYGITATTSTVSVALSN